MYPELEKAQHGLEYKFLNAQKGVESEAQRLYKESPKKAIAYLTKYSSEQALFAHSEWKKFGEYLLIKYMDGVVRKEKNGEFIRNEHGQPSSPQRVGYPDRFYREVVKQTGDKYKVTE